MLVEAKQGEAESIVFVVKRQKWEHRAFIVGEYRHDPTGALAAAVMLVGMLNHHADTTVAALPSWEKCEGCKTIN